MRGFFFSTDLFDYFKCSHLSQSKNCVLPYSWVYCLSYLNLWSVYFHKQLLRECRTDHSHVRYEVFHKMKLKTIFFNIQRIWTDFWICLLYCFLGSLIYWFIFSFFPCRSWYLEGLTLESIFFQLSCSTQEKKKKKAGIVIFSAVSVLAQMEKFMFHDTSLSFQLQ